MEEESSTPEAADPSTGSPGAVADSTVRLWLIRDPLGGTFVSLLAAPPPLPWILSTLDTREADCQTRPSNELDCQTNQARRVVVEWDSFSGAIPRVLTAVSRSINMEEAAISTPEAADLSITSRGAVLDSTVLLWLTQDPPGSTFVALTGGGGCVGLRRCYPPKASSLVCRLPFRRHRSCLPRVFWQLLRLLPGFSPRWIRGKRIAGIVLLTDSTARRTGHVVWANGIPFGRRTPTRLPMARHAAPWSGGSLKLTLRISFTDRRNIGARSAASARLVAVEHAAASSTNIAGGASARADTDEVAPP
ncbi:hypothetical protein HPB47_003055 [Ixodes persulcatus]|uniref:Uncharacterized protein n=1 Tax=Ixodes persulcatus TaxID=34615 RepID=A0AC60PL53_IXOPE|nr:hypothetical protein HPB47_003055 [Ixodes persulcatus]